MKNQCYALKKQEEYESLANEANRFLHDMNPIGAESIASKSGAEKGIKRVPILSSTMKDYLIMENLHLVHRSSGSIDKSIVNNA